MVEDEVGGVSWVGAWVGVCGTRTRELLVYMPSGIHDNELPVQLCNYVTIKRGHVTLCCLCCFINTPLAQVVPGPV